MFSIRSVPTGEGRYPGDHLQTPAGLSLDPGLRRDERLKGMFSIKSAHTGECRYPGDHLQTSAGPSLDPGLRRGERRKGTCFQLDPFLPAKAGIQEIICKRLRACLWIPACAGMSG